MVATRRRANAAEEDPSEQLAKRPRVSSGKRNSAPSQALEAIKLVGSPEQTKPKRTAKAVPKSGSRGAAYMAAMGVTRPPMPAASPCDPSASMPTPGKASPRNPSTAQPSPQPLRPPATASNSLLKQALPCSLAALQDMFGGLQTVYEVMRKRGQRTTYQLMRQAVEEASGRRFLLPHAAQLAHLLPETLSLEWVRLPVAAHSSRTEPHLLVTLDTAAAATAAALEGAAGEGAGQLQATRSLLQCRLAAHLLRSYQAHLEARAAELQRAGDAAGAQAARDAARAAAQPPVECFATPFPEGVEEVPQAQLPPRPDAPSRGGSPAILGAAAAPAQRQSVPGTPATSSKLPPTTTGRTGRPPMHPNTVEAHHLRHRRLSFSQAAEAGGAGPQATPSPAAIAAAAGRAAAAGCSTAARTPLDRLHSDLNRQLADQPMDAQPHFTAQDPGFDAAAELHPKQAALAAALTPEDLRFNGAVPSSQDDAALLASMPADLRRLSTEGIISLDTLRMLDAAEQQHRGLSSQEARERRDSNAALGELPRTFSRVQRIFGVQGPNALKLHDVILRIKRGGAETSSEAQIEAQLRALAEHAPDFMTLKPYGRCGTPALWIDRACRGNAVMQRLKEVAAGRLQQAGAPQAPS